MGFRILGYNEEQKTKYVQEVIKADFAEVGDEDVFRKIKNDLNSHNIDDNQIREKMDDLTKKLNQNLFNIILLFFFTISNGFAENKIVGKAKVIDGDTIKIKNINIRFGGIDAPESYFKGKPKLV